MRSSKFIITYSDTYEIYSTQAHYLAYWHKDCELDSSREIYLMLKNIGNTNLRNSDSSIVHME